MPRRTGLCTSRFIFVTLSRVTRDELRDKMEIFIDSDAYSLVFLLTCITVSCVQICADLLRPISVLCGFVALHFLGIPFRVFWCLATFCFTGSERPCACPNMFERAPVDRIRCSSSDIIGPILDARCVQVSIVIVVRGLSMYILYIIYDVKHDSYT